MTDFGGVVLVTGASSGIGRALARQLASQARTLILVARRVDRLETLRAELTQQHPQLAVELAPADLADVGATRGLVDGLLARHGAVDVLINNAGLGDVGLFEQADEAKLLQMIHVNITALTVLTRRLLPAMLAQKRGAILNISSGFGMAFLPGVAVYAGTKFYVTGFTESLRLELRGTGIVVTQSCPGPVDTEFEAIAGNPTGQKVPGWIQISAEQCARESLAALRRDRALVVPGFVIRSVLFLGNWTPRWVLRIMYSWMGGYLRRRQAAGHSP